MKQILNYSLLIIITVFTSFIPNHQADSDFKIRILASGLSDPWSIVVGPDQELWVSESKGCRILKINPENGAKMVVLDLNNERQFPSFQQLKKEGRPVPQGGVMGLALHPQFLKGKPYVYLSYVYKYLEENRFLLRLVRYDFDFKKQQLRSPVIISDTIPASNDHNGGRMLIAPTARKNYLFYAVGDQGSGQFSNGGKQNKAQLKSSYEGKILRFNLEVEKSGGWIPADNPALPKRTAIWTFGHRNPQGLAFAIINHKERLYSSEHGPYSDDEINLIEKGRNYGHPLIIGYADGNYDGLAASVSDSKDYPGIWHTTYPIISSEKRNADSIGKSFKAPTLSFFPAAKITLNELFKKAKAGEKTDWNAYAPSGIAVYQSDAVPEWNPSLLITSLKTGKLLRVKLNRDGSINPKTYAYAASRARYRDVAISLDGTKIYVATDSSAITSGPTAENPKVTSQRGCILEMSIK